MTFDALLDELQVPAGDIVYVQSSMDWVRRAGFDAPEVMRALRARVGASGTLVMPTYPFRTTQLEYLTRRPTYDVVRTPAAVGLLAELFRRAPDAQRSLDPDFCISAAGSAASEIVRTDARELDPFGRRSTYERLLQRGATLLGIGVSLNTNSFIHVIDSMLAPSYQFPVYCDDLFDATVIDRDGHAAAVRRRALRPELQRLTRPSAIAERVGGDEKMFSHRVVAGASFFRWNLTAWRAWCLDHAAAMLCEGAVPCWLTRLTEGCGAA